MLDHGAAQRVARAGGFGEHRSREGLAGDGGPCRAFNLAHEYRRAGPALRTRSGRGAAAGCAAVAGGAPLRRSRGCCIVRRVQPRRPHRRHRLGGQDGAAVGGGLGPRDRRPARPRGCCVVRRFSPDGRTVVTGSGDKTARLWEVASGREIAVLRGHEDAVSSVAFSPDGRTVVTGSGDKTARLWEVASRPRDRRPARPRGCCVVRRVQPRRPHRRHRLAGQDRAAVGGGLGPRDRRPARPRGCCIVRRLQPRRPHRRHRLVGQDRAAVGGGHRAARSPSCAATRVTCRPSPSAPTAAPSSPARRTRPRGCGRWPRAARSPSSAATRMLCRPSRSAPTAAPSSPARATRPRGCGRWPRTARSPSSAATRITCRPSRSAPTAAPSSPARGTRPRGCGRWPRAARSPSSAATRMRCRPSRSAPTAAPSSPALATRPRGCGRWRRASEIAVLRGHEDAVWSVAFSPDGRTVVTGSVGQDRAAVGGGDGPGDRRPARPRGCCVVRRLQPRRPHRRHRLGGQDRAAVGGGLGPRDRRPARPRGCGVVRRLQPRRPHRRHRLFRQDRAAVGGGRAGHRTRSASRCRRPSE